MAASLLVAPNLNAQYAGSGGLFDRGEASDDMNAFVFWGLMRQVNEDEYGYNLFNQQFGSDDEGGYELYNQTFGQDNEEAPLGSGLLVLTAAGALYTLKKRKNNNKRTKQH